MAVFCYHSLVSIIGIDEVGRGCWAGPLLVVAARAKAELPEGLADSKLLSKKRREGLVDAIAVACDLGEGWVLPKEIDELGLTGAMKLGVRRALLGLGASFDADIILDGIINYCPAEFMNVKTIAKADQTHPIVSAASIHAKVTRDSHMARAAKIHPYYGFEQHVGYGTAIHRAALKVHGVSMIHRKSYKPVRAFL